MFAVLIAGYLLPISTQVPDSWVLPALIVMAAAFLTCPIASYKIGIQFPSPSWSVGPLVAMVVALLVILVLPEEPPRRTALGSMSHKDEFLFILLWGGWILLLGLAIVYAILVY